MPNDADRAGTPAGVFGAELRYAPLRPGSPSGQQYLNRSCTALSGRFSAPRRLHRRFWLSTAPVVGLAASPASSLHKVPAASCRVSTASPVLCT